MDSSETPASVTVTWGVADQVAAPAWAGTVTAVTTKPGDTLETGDAILTVDAQLRIAAHTPEPFFRTLSAGDIGTDVTMLQELLSRLGYYQGELDGNYETRTEKAMTSWATDLGISEPIGSFDPQWLVWLPFDGFLVSSIDARVGFPAPAHGTSFLVGPQPILEALLFDRDGLLLAMDGDWVLELDGESIPLTDGLFEADAFRTLASTIGEGITQASGVARRRMPRHVLELPATAVVSDSDGNLCVWLRIGEQFDPRTVDLGGGLAGRVTVVSGIEPGVVVLANPGEVLAEPTCP